MILELNDVNKIYPNGVNALHDVNLEIEEGEFVYIIGATGSGKSTLIKLIDGEEVPTSGTVISAGVNVGKLRHSKVPLYRRNIGVVFQDFKLLPQKTTFENVAFALEVINMSDLEIRKRTESGRIGRQGEGIPERTFGRSAAACRYCQSHCEQAEDPDCGRTDRKLGPGNRKRHYGTAESDQRTGRLDHFDGYP